MYDYLVVGSGLYGATFAHEAHQHGKSVLVIDKRPNIAGNIYTEKVEGINFHKYGALYAEYKKLADAEDKVIFGGRLGEYKYYDMDAVVASALEMSKKELG